MGIWKPIGLVLGGIGTVMMFGAGIKPEDAISNIAGWAKLLGLDAPTNPAIDKLVFMGGGLLVATALFIWLFRRLRRDKPQPPQSKNVIEPSKLGVVIENVDAFMPGDQNIGSTGIVVGIRIWNSGEPVYVTEWGLKVEASGEFVGRYAHISPGGLTLNGPRPKTLMPNQEIAAALGQEPVGNTPVSGLLQFYFDCPLDEIYLQNARLILTVQDSANRKAIHYKEMSSFAGYGAAAASLADSDFKMGKDAKWNLVGFDRVISSVRSRIDWQGELNAKKHDDEN